MRRFIGGRGDALLAAALAALYLFEIFTEPDFAGERAVSLPAALAFSASLAWRRRIPLVPLLLATFVIELSNFEAPALAETGAFLFGVVITIYSVGAYTDGRTTIVGGLLVLVALPLAAIEPGESTTLSDVGFFLMFLGGPFVVGRVMRRRRAHERVLTGRAEELELEGEERARAAVVEERARIARELHDVVAHALSVMVLQARGGRRALAPEAQRVREAFDTIERSGRQALEEMRRLLGVLRQSDEELALAPQPSLRRLEDLVGNVRQAGLPVELEVDGEIGGLPPGVDVSAYRIVQEALTNALKHAGPARARVRISRSEGDLEIQVLDDGGGPASSDGSGHGLVGMAERVAVYGGKLEAGKQPEGGYLLNARLPLSSER